MDFLTIKKNQPAFERKAIENDDDDDDDEIVDGSDACKRMVRIGRRRHKMLPIFFCFPGVCFDYKHAFLVLLGLSQPIT